MISPVYVSSLLLTQERLKLISEIPIAQNHDLIETDYYPEMAHLKGGS